MIFTQEVNSPPGVVILSSTATLGIDRLLLVRTIPTSAALHMGTRPIGHCRTRLPQPCPKEVSIL